MYDFNKNLEEVIKEAIREKLDDDAYEIICENLPRDDAEWWADKICEPIKKVLIDELSNRKNTDLLMECFEKVVAEYCILEDIEDKVQDAVDRIIQRAIKLPKYKIVFEDEKAGAEGVGSKERKQDS